MSLVKDTGVGYNIEDDEPMSDCNRNEKETTIPVYSYIDKCNYASVLLKEKFHNSSLAEKFSGIIEECKEHEQKVQLVRIFIEDFDKVPLALNDQLEEDNLEIQFRMESLAAAHLSFIESLVSKIVRRYSNINDIADYFTRVVYAEPSYFNSPKERAYALFRGTWLIHDLSRNCLKINWHWA